MHTILNKWVKSHFDIPRIGVSENVYKDWFIWIESNRVVWILSDYVETVPAYSQRRFSGYKLYASDPEFFEKLCKYLRFDIWPYSLHHGLLNHKSNDCM